MKELKIYRCNECGQVVLVLNDAGPAPVCSGEEMELLVADTVDAAREKHVPQVTRNGNQVDVQVGSVLHPMLEAHYIEFILLQQNDQLQLAWLHPGGKPTVSFMAAEGPIKVYEFCNLHGLWLTEA